MCERRIFTERLPQTVQPKARRTIRLGDSQRAIGFAAGGAAGSRLAGRLAMPVSGETLLRMITAAEFEPAKAPRVVGIDDWAWRKGQRYGTIICDLERNRVLDLLPDRTAETVASWLGSHPGIEIVARDRAGTYADGARRGAPDATQVADRWRLPQGSMPLARPGFPKRRAAMIPLPNQRRKLRRSSLARLRRLRRNQRRERYVEILRLRQSGMSPRQIAPQIDVAVRTVERWLAAGGEPELRGAPDRPEHPGPLMPRMLQNRQRHRLANPSGRCSRGVVPWPSRRSNQPEYPCPALTCSLGGLYGGPEGLQDLRPLLAPPIKVRRPLRADAGQGLIYPGGLVL